MNSQPRVRISGWCGRSRPTRQVSRAIRRWYGSASVDSAKQAGSELTYLAICGPRSKSNFAYGADGQGGGRGQNSPGIGPGDPVISLAWSRSQQYLSVTWLSWHSSVLLTDPVQDALWKTVQDRLVRATPDLAAPNATVAEQAMLVAADVPPGPDPADRVTNLTGTPFTYGPLHSCDFDVAANTHHFDRSFWATTTSASSPASGWSWPPTSRRHRQWCLICRTGSSVAIPQAKCRRTTVPDALTHTKPPSRRSAMMRGDGSTTARCSAASTIASTSPSCGRARSWPRSCESCSREIRLLQRSRNWSQQLPSGSQLTPARSRSGMPRTRMR